MRIEVHLSPVFRDRLGVPHLSVELEEKDATVSVLLRRLCERFGGKIEALLFEPGSGLVLPGLMVMVNDQVYTGTTVNTEGIELGERDRVTLLYFLSGG
jgi:sulfur carrier protein ThiS